MRNKKPAFTLDSDSEIKIAVIVNGRQKVALKRILTFEEVIVMTFPMHAIDSKNIAFTVTYKSVNKKGSLSVGDKIKIETGMIFNVTATDKS